MSQTDAIQAYITLLKDYNTHTNIYSRKAYDRLDYHIEDGLQMAELIGDGPVTVLDIGSGSGLPAIPIAIANPQNHVIAVESKSRKTRFLDSVKDALGLNNLRIVNQNIYEFVQGNPGRHFDFVTAKAFGSIEKIEGIVKGIKGTGVDIMVTLSEAQVREMDQTHIACHGPYFYYRKHIKPKS